MTVIRLIRSVAWLRLLLDKWMDKLRGYHKIGETAVMPGAKLADLVTKHMCKVFTEHRKALKKNRLPLQYTGSGPASGPAGILAECPAAGE